MLFGGENWDNRSKILVPALDLIFGAVSPYVVQMYLPPKVISANLDEELQLYKRLLDTEYVLGMGLVARLINVIIEKMTINFLDIFFCFF